MIGGMIFGEPSVDYHYHVEAIADFDQAISLNSEDSLAYNGRGLAKFDLGDTQEAIADFNQAISLNSEYAHAYYNRGLAKSNLGDKQGEIADFKKAADLYQQQGKTTEYQDALEQINKLRKSQ